MPDQELLEKLKQAFSAENAEKHGVQDRLIPIGEIRKGSRLYKLYSGNAHNDKEKYFYKTFIIKNGREISEYEAIFNKKEKTNWRKKQ